MPEGEKKKGGRPPFFDSPESLQEKVDSYFAECEGKLLTDSDNKPILDKFGHPIIYGDRPMTTAGLAYHLGFMDKSSLYDYKGKAAFRSIIQRAIFRIEVYTNERLFDKDGCNGARFSLENNFKGYDSAKEAAREGASVLIINDIPREQPKSEAVTENVE